jgi:hypothetical protein
MIFRIRPYLRRIRPKRKPGVRQRGAADEALADLRQSKADFAAGDTFTVDEVRAELERRRRGAAR